MTFFTINGKHLIYFVGVKRATNEKCKILNTTTCTCVCHRVVGEHAFAAEDVPAVGFDRQDNFAQTNRTVMLAGSNAP